MQHMQETAQLEPSSADQGYEIHERIEQPYHLG